MTLHTFNANFLNSSRNECVKIAQGQFQVTILVTRVLALAHKYSGKKVVSSSSHLSKNWWVNCKDSNVEHVYHPLALLTWGGRKTVVASANKKVKIQWQVVH